MKLNLLKQLIREELQNALIDEELNEGPLKNLALGALTAASLAGSPKVQAFGGHKDKIEYTQSTSEEKARKKEILDAFMKFLKANRAGRIDILIQQAKETSDFYTRSGIYEEILDDFMESTENLPVGTTYAESEFLKKYLEKIAQ